VGQTNRVRVVAVITALALALGLLTLALMAKPTQGQAQTQHFNERIPIDDIVLLNECTGELVHIEGTFHETFHITQDANGGFHAQTTHYNFVGEGVGLTSGDEYVVREVSNMTGNVQDVEDPSAQQNFTMTYTFHVMRKGSDSPEDDFLWTFVVHNTISANGELTSEVVRASVKCN